MKTLRSFDFSNIAKKIPILFLLSWYTPTSMVSFSLFSFKPKSYIDQISDLLPDKYSPIQKNGNGNQGCYLASISVPLGELLIQLSKTANHIIDDLVTSIVSNILDDDAEEEIESQDIVETEKEQLVKTRRGQGCEFEI